MLPVRIAQDGLADGEARGVQAVHVAPAEAPDDAGGAVGGVQARGLLDLALGDAGDLRGHARGVLPHALVDGVEHGPALDLGAVEQGDLAGGGEHRVDRGAVGPGVVAVLVGAPGQDAAAVGVPDDEVLRLPVRLDHVGAQELAGVLAQQEHGVGPVLHEVLVVELLRDDVVDPGVADDGVGVRVGLQPLVGASALGDAHRVYHDELRRLVLADGGLAVDDAPQRRLGRVGLLGALPPVDDGPRLRGRRGHHGLDGPADHGHVQGVVPAPADGARVDDVARVAEQVGEAGARPQVVGAVGALGGHERLGAVLADELPEPLGDLPDRLVVGDLLPAVLAALADAPQRVVDALGVVVELDGALAALAEAVAEHRALVVVGAELDQAAGPRVHAAPDAAVHVAEVAAGAAPADAVLVHVVVGQARHGGGLVHYSVSIY